MTLFDFTTEECHACGGPTPVAVLISCTTFGPPDLDTRPAPMLRDVLEDQIAECASCGYCWAPGEEEGAEAEALDAVRAATVVTSGPYRAALGNTAVPEAARRFLARSVLDAEMADLASAGWSALKASWVCDDADEPSAARDARSEALRLWEDALACGQTIHHDEGADVILRAELERRNGGFDAAAELIEARLPDIENEDIATVLAYCRELCRAQDASVHTVGEAFE